MTLLERTILFLRDRAPAAYCDDCLDQVLDLPHGEAKIATEPLAMTELFSHEAETCSVCGRVTPAIRHVEEF